MTKIRLSPIERIEKINQQIEKLKQQQQNVQKSFEIKITNLLKKEKAYNHDFNILYGAVLDITQKLHDHENNKDQIGHWEQIGKLVLDKKKKSDHEKENKKDKNDEMQKSENLQVSQTHETRQKLKLKLN